VDLRWNELGLLPVIALDRLTGEVRMLAWANVEALEKTVRTSQATFFSRSRSALWTKGETSGNVMKVARVLVDCDEDTLIYEVDPGGPSCHTGSETCFFRELSGAEAARGPILVRLDDVLEARKSATAKASYTRSLYEGGTAKIGEKVREEAGELAAALEAESDERVVDEAADVLFHVMVGLRARGLSIRRVLEVLADRFGTGGHVEKSERAVKRV
jgi:phosphoribosyl-ATP pyrophosphohydrolase/phosphoribosyl-AMP cyclohydrolase